MNISLVVLQVEPLVCEETRVKLIGYDGNITERILGESNVHLCGVSQLTLMLQDGPEVNVLSVSLTPRLSLLVCQTDELVVTPATDEAQKAFNDLTTVGRLQQEL